MVQGSRVQGCGGGFVANIYGAMPEGLGECRFPVLSSPNIDRVAADDKDFSLALEMTIRESR